MRQVSIMDNGDISQSAFMMGLLAPGTQVYDAIIDGAVTGLCLISGRSFSEELHALADRLGTEREDKRMEDARADLIEHRDSLREMFSDPDCPVRVECFERSVDGEIKHVSSGQFTVDTDNPLTEADVREPSDEELSSLLRGEGAA